MAAELLRALIVEDNPDDADLLERALRRAGYDPRTRRVDSMEALRTALAEPWDIVYSDFQLVGFDALAALDFVRRVKGSDVPFVVVSGMVGEEVAVQVMRAGADDYFRKEHIERIPSATARSLRESASRKKADSAERRALEAERKLREEAEAANRVKDEFLLTLSHELRTPLNAILGWSTLLRAESKSDGRLGQGLAVVERGARHLTRLIDELLDVSRLSTGKLTIAAQVLAFAPLVESALVSVRSAIDARQIRVDKAFDDVGPIYVYGDPGRLQQVVGNVLANAVKFTPDHGVVTLRLAREGSRALLTVSDSGIGIAADFLPHVFERFRQADGSTTRRHGGLGLGLAIAKDIVELHGGTITAESAGEGKGATLAIRLPIADAPSAADHPLPEPAGAVGLKDVRVLAVDDDADARELLRAALESSGAVVRLAASANDALDLLRTWRPDVLLSDIGMPYQDGYEFLRAVRARGAAEGGQIPAVALTAYASEEDARRAIGAGYQMHLAKPVDVDGLLHAVERLAEQSRTR